jgi:PAS domain S-box-containing protein
MSSEPVYLRVWRGRNGSMRAAVRRFSRFLAGLAVVAVVMSAAVAADLRALDVALVGLAVAVSVVLGSWLLAASVALRSTRSALTHESATMEQFFIDARLGMALTGSDLRWVRVNPALCRMLGYSEDELVGHSPNEFTHPDDAGLTERGFHTMITDPRAGLDLEKRYVARDGSIIWVLVTVSASRDPATGDEIHMAQIQDITKRKQAELAYAEERHLLDEFLTHVPEQVYFKDLGGRFLRVSRSLAKRRGFDTPVELVGMTDFDIFDQVHASKAFADEQRIISTEVPLLEFEEQEIWDGVTRGGATGSRRDAWVVSTKMPLHDTSGAIIGTFGVSKDITLRKRGELALRESEGRWQTLLAHLQEIVVLVDLSGLVTYTTPSIQRWLGYEPEELVGTEMLDKNHPDDREAVGRTFEEVQPGEPRLVTHRVRHRDGGWHTLQSTLISLRDDPAIRAVLIASVDITEHVAIEEERQRLELERRVSHRLEAVGQLAAGIAHEINTPLQFVGDSVSFLQDAVTELLGLVSSYRELMSAEVAISHKERQTMMREAEEQADVEYLNERIPAAFERTADGVARVRSIVQAMKRFSHAGGTELSPADINEAIETTLEVCRSEYKYVAIVGLQLGEVPLVTCNAGEINQVLLNLIINAAQAIEEQHREGGQLGEITISTAAEDDHVVITVTDDGPGMPNEVQDRIYEPFFTTKEVGKGTGQGLALARASVDRHNGSLNCESSPGQGTTFTIHLPIRHTPAGEPEGVI